MKFAESMLRLYAVTDRSWLGNQTLAQQVEQALRGGATCVQLREKELNDTDFLAEAKELKILCARYGVPLIINDNVGLALEVDADGVHVGQSDMEALDVRTLLGPDKIIGVSAKNVEEALLAEKHGADYLGVGAVFPTSSKDDASEVSHLQLKEICSSVKIPVVAIGGITKNNVQQLKGSGICGISVISAIFSQKDIKSATMELRKNTEEMLKD